MSTMRIHIRLFSIIREKAGTGALTLDLESPACVSDAAAMLAGRFPILTQDLQRVAFAVNQTYANGDVLLRDQDELAVIPAVSGGLPA